MKFLVLFALFVASAVALPLEDAPLHGIATPEHMRDMLVERIIQGWSAVNGQFPHQAFLITSDNSGNSFVCGGSLISARWVVTAGHCLYELSQAQVHLGNVAYASSPIKITSRNVFVHPSYNPSTLNNDIALIDMGQSVPISANVSPIKILNSQSDLHTGKVAIVSGFGLTSDSGSVSQTLNYVNLTIISNTQCAQTYGNSVIISSTICGNGITSGAQGSCSGDSGGPLILREASGDTLVGIVSFGSSAGCTANVPSGFVRPNLFTSWITSVSGITFPSS